ncbi:MAG: phenylacetate--CoA ligase family protein [Deltaproteobacteria bacterium]|nr:phenylacetate--CoA ligase family protein [Deltaproteobacteria bacterium]
MSQAHEIAAFGLELVQAYRRTSASRELLREVQARRLRAVLDAASRTRFYGGKPLRHLRDVEPVRKAQYQARLDDTFTDKQLSKAALLAFVHGGGAPGALLFDRYLVATTSGTTGHVGVFVDDVAGWSRQRAVVFARMFQGMLTAEGFAMLARRRYRLAFVIASGGHWLTSILAGRMPTLGRAFADSRIVPVDAPLPTVVRELNAFQPLLLHSYPTFLEVLCAEARKGALRIDPEIVSAGSEPLSLACREAVRATFPKARLVETYAATECLAMATSCPHGAVHVNEDACMLEPVDDRLEPVAPGVEASRVLVTNLSNVVQPLVRYELTDSVSVDDAPCPCGSAMARIKVRGRTDDTFFLVDGQGRAQAHPPIPIEVAFLGVPGLLQYQLVHEAQNRLRLSFVADEGAPPGDVAAGLDARLTRYLKDHGLLEHVGYLVEQIDAVERHAKSKKLRQIESRVARPPGEVVAAIEARR